MEFRLKEFMGFPLKAAAPGVLCMALALPGFSQSTHRGAPAKSSQIAHGEYLVKGIAGCGDCHTPMNNRGEPIAGQWLKGSPLSFKPAVPFPAWAPVAPAIAGLPGWTAQDAVRLMMTGIASDGKPPRPPMPQYRMNRADAEAVVAYLKSLK